VTSDIGVTEPLVGLGGSGAERFRARHVLVLFGIALVISIGLLVRIWAIGCAPINSDTAVVGLMAHEILRGHFFAFYWGQRYGGVEPYAVAAMFAIFGQSSFTLAITPVLLDALCAILTWRIGSRVFSKEIGVGAALLFWVWPEVDVWQSTIEHGFRFAALCCGLGLLLVALRMTEGTKRSVAKQCIDASLFGVLAGLGFWASPEIAYYFLPALALFTWRALHRRYVPSLVEVALGVIAACVGGLPWIYDNVSSGFASFKHAPQPARGIPYFDHLKVMFAHVLPIMAGLQLRQSGHWIFSPALSWILYAIALLLGVVWICELIRRRRGLVIVTASLLFPVLYAYSPFTWNWADGRYAIYLAPLDALLVVAGLSYLLSIVVARCASLKLGEKARRVVTSRASGPVLGIALGLALTLGATTLLAPYMPVSSPLFGRTGWFSWRADPTEYATTVSDALENDGIHDVYAGYWLAYPLSFASRGGVVASDVRYDRYVPYLGDVEHSRDPAWVFANPKDQVPAAAVTGSSLLDPGCAVLTDRCLLPSDLESYLLSAHDNYRVIDVMYFVAIVPRTPVDPDLVFRHFHIPTSFI